MTRRSRFALAAAAVIIVVVVAIGVRARRSSTPAGSAETSSTARPRTVDPRFTEALARTGRSARLPFAAFGDDEAAEVTIAGTVIDAKTGAPVGDVEVVFRNESGEQTVVAGADGRYRIVLARGRYRAFVRDESVLSVGRPEVVRLPTLPSAETAGVPDEGLMPLLVVTRDADSVDLAVQRGGTITGQVIDLRGKPIAGAVVRARGGALRPALGTDAAETDASGHFELHLPAGAYGLEATHERFAGVSGFQERIQLPPGGKHTSTLTLTAGCMITGRVVDARGKASSDGAIEKRWGVTELEYGPAGRVESDGSFRWVTTEEIDVTLRAWPWKSPPSASRTFTCRDGARFTDVVFKLGDRAPDIEGTLTDETGAPVPFAFVDFAPQDPGGIGQQERTDAQGHWQVFNMPAGRYRVSASAPGHGVTVAAVLAPKRDVALQLGGVGRIEGTTALLANGVFEISELRCADPNQGRGDIGLSQQQRLVQVVAGRFTIEDIPACLVLAHVTWRDQNLPLDVVVPPNGVGTVDLPIGPPRPKRVHGVVRDAEGRPTPDVTVTAEDQASHVTSTRTDATGRYSIQTVSGARLMADGPGAWTVQDVGMANVDDEVVDLALGPAMPDE